MAIGYMLLTLLRARSVSFNNDCNPSAISDIVEDSLTWFCPMVSCILKMDCMASPYELDNSIWMCQCVTYPYTIASNVTWNPLVITFIFANRFFHYSKFHGHVVLCCICTYNPQYCTLMQPASPSSVINAHGNTLTVVCDPVFLLFPDWSRSV